MRNLFKKAIPIEPEPTIPIPASPETDKEFFDRGMIYYGQQNYESALSDFEQALAIDSTSFDAWYGRGLVWKSLAKFQDAENAFQKVIELLENPSENEGAERVFMLRRLAKAQIGNVHVLKDIT